MVLPEPLPGAVVDAAERAVDHGQAGLEARGALLVVGLRGAAPLGQQHVRRRPEAADGTGGQTVRPQTPRANRCTVPLGT